MLKAAPDGAAAAVAVIWGLCFVVIQASLPSETPLLLGGLRALTGGIVLAMAAAIAQSRDMHARRAAAQHRASSVGLPSIPVLLTLGLTNAALAFGAMYLAAGRAEAAVASILAGGQPIALAVAGWALFGERVSPRVAAGMAVAMGGIVVVATANSGVASLEGTVLALLATVAPAAGTVLMRRLGSSVALVATTSAQFLIGGVMLIAVSAILEPWSAFTWSSGVLLGLLILGVLGTGVAYVVWFWLLDRLPFARLGAALFLVPVVGVVASIATGDRPQPGTLLGITAVLLGFGVVQSVHAGEISGVRPAT